MKRKNNPILILLSILLGGFFIFSAWSKTTPNLYYFEHVIHSQIGVNDFTASLSARFFIGLEAALGLMMLVNVFGRKKWVLKACMALLVVFSIHLVLLWIRQGSAVDCGCMGSMVKMNPWESLIKNIVLMALIAVLWRFAPEERNGYNHVLSIIVTLIIIAAPFVIYPITAKTISISKLYAPEEPEKPLENLRTGKHIVCFMSLTCPHCRDAATLIQEIHKNHADIPFYIFFPHEQGKDSIEHVLLQDFKQQTKINNIPHSFISLKSFVDMIHAVGEDGVPTMLWLNDTTIIRKMNEGDLLDTASIIPKMNNWLAK